MAKPHQAENPFVEPGSGERKQRIDVASTQPSPEMVEARQKAVTKANLEALPDSDMIRRYQPVFLGQGGENLVYHASPRLSGKTQELGDGVVALSELKSDVVIKAEKE